MRHHYRRRACVLSLVATGLALFSVARGATGSSELPDRVAYTTFRPGQWDIYLFRHRGEAPIKLTGDAGLHYDPVVSPEGRWLVYTSEQRGNPNLYAVDLKNPGSTPHLLIDSGSMEDQAALSPDGEWMAFVSTAGGNADIYLARFRPDATLHMSDATNLIWNDPVKSARW